MHHIQTFIEKKRRKNALGLTVSNSKMKHRVVGSQVEEENSTGYCDRWRDLLSGYVSLPWLADSCIWEDGW